MAIASISTSLFIAQFFSVVLLCAPVLANAVDSPSEVANEDPAENVLDERETTAGLLNQLDSLQSINVTQQVADSSIQKRITNILNTSEWFDELSVAVTEGIVTLQGDTALRDHRQWAEAIASRTEGVVAVINKIHVVTDANGNLSPVIDESRALMNKFISALPLILFCVLVIVIVLLVARYVSALSYRLFASRINSIMLGRLVARLCALPVLLVGIFLVLNITGLGSLAATVIGGTGLLGLVIGFAFRDIAENFLASILISIQRPFRLGDTIKVLDFTGIVQAVTTRGTVLMNLEGNHVQIPNTIIYKEPITNFSANPNMRLDFRVGIGYDSSISRAQEVAMQILQEHSAVLNHPESMVLAEELSASTVILRIYFWVDSKAHSVLKVKSAIIRLVKHRFIQEGISMPDDAREVIFPQGIQVTTTALAADRTSERETKPLLNQTTDSVSASPELKTQKRVRGHLDEGAISTPAEANLTTDTPILEQQAEASVLGDDAGNLLKKR